MSIEQGGPSEEEIQKDTDSSAINEVNVAPEEVVIQKDSSSIDWNKYIGSEINVVYKEDNETVLQNVTSLESMEDHVMTKAIKDFSIDAKKELGPGYFIGECGRWVVLGKDSYYSEIFDSGGINHIVMKDALRSLTALADKHMGKGEIGEDINGLILLHTHPLGIDPLSLGDIRNFRKIGGILGDENYRLEIYAVPTNGEAIFNHRLSKEEIQQATAERAQTKK